MSQIFESMRMRVENENESWEWEWEFSQQNWESRLRVRWVFLESLNFEIEMRVSQKSAGPDKLNCLLMQDKMHIGQSMRQELIDYQISLGRTTSLFQKL